MLNHPGKAGPTAAAKDRMPRPEWNTNKSEMKWFDSKEFQLHKPNYV